MWACDHDSAAEKYAILSSEGDLLTWRQRDGIYEGKLITERMVADVDTLGLLFGRKAMVNILDIHPTCTRGLGNGS